MPYSRDFSMISPAANSSKTPPYSESELYDSPEQLARWPLLAPLLKSWQTEVWEKDHTEFRGSWQYDQRANRAQHWHRLAVILAACAGTAAVVLAILQLGLEHRICGPYLADSLRNLVGSSLGSAAMQQLATSVLMYLEVFCLVSALVIIGPSLLYSLDHRWREYRFKAEHYRMLKFRFLHDAERWLRATEEERGLQLFVHLSQIHAVDRQGIKAWIHWKREFVPALAAPDEHPDPALAAEISDYFCKRRLQPQHKYFQHRGHKLHRVEKVVRWVGPGLFGASIACAMAHVALHLAHEVEERRATSSHVSTADETSKRTAGHESAKTAHHPVSGKVMWAFVLALLAAILPVIAAGVRTWKGAFEFGRNSLRFESMAHHLDYLLGELKEAKTPEAILALLRRGEYAMESEHRAWMRLMMEAEWFG